MAAYPNAPAKKPRWLPPGPWDAEPSYHTWYIGEFRCVISRSELTGVLSARAEIPHGHPMHGLTPEQINRQLIVVPHRGVSVAIPLYSRWSAELRFGHPGDLLPVEPEKGGVYRSFEFVKATLEDFVSQLQARVA